MKNNPAFSFVAGVILTAALFFGLGQMSPAQAVGRYQIETARSEGVYVVDTVTGSVKFIPHGMSPTPYGKPFEALSTNSR